MNAVARLYDSTIGKKIAMAITGLIWVGYVFVHMLGNMTFFAGPEMINEYGHKIQSSGPLIWGIRFVLLASLIIHVTAAIQLVRRNRAARPEAYAAGRKNARTNVAALTMRYGGILLLAYVVFHIFDLTVGWANPDFIRGDVYHNLVASLSNPLVGIFYILAMVALGFHLFHGVWSLFQTLGANHPKYNDWRRKLAVFVAVFVSIGFAAVPVAILAGFTAAQ